MRFKRRAKSAEAAEGASTPSRGERHWHGRHVAWLAFSFLGVIVLGFIAAGLAIAEGADPYSALGEFLAVLLVGSVLLLLIFVSMGVSSRLAKRRAR